MGEVLKSTFGKRHMKKGSQVIRTEMVGKHQWGIAVPGACEALCQWRSTLEDMARADKMGPILICDIDQVNMFGKYCRHFADISCSNPDLPQGWYESEVDRAIRVG